MKTCKPRTHAFRMLLVICIGISLSLFASQRSYAQCTTNPPSCPIPSIDDWNNIYSKIQNKDWNWECFDCKYWYALTDNVPRKLDIPFYDGVRGRRLKGIVDSKDYQKQYGWELIQRDFGQRSSTNDPYFILYNKYTSVLRVYWFNMSLNPSASTNQQIIFTLTNHADGPTGILATGNDVMNSADQYHSGEVNGSDDIMVFVTPNPGRDTWVVGEFQLGFFPYLSDPKYRLTAFDITIGGRETSTLSGSITGSSITKDLEESSSNPAVDGVTFSGKKASVSKLEDNLIKLNTASTKAIAHLAKADTARRKLHSAAMKSLNALSGKQGSFWGKIKKSNEKVMSLTSDEGTFKKLFSSASKILGAAGGGLEVFKAIKGVVGFLSGKETEDEDAPPAPQPIRPLLTTYDLKLSGEITTRTTLKTITIKVPGVSYDPAWPNNTLPWYDCPMGTIALNTEPKVEKITFERKIERVDMDASFSSKSGVTYCDKDYISGYPKTGKRSYTSYRVANDLNLSFNQASGLEVVSVKLALVAQGKVILDPSFVDKTPVECLATGVKRSFTTYTLGVLNQGIPLGYYEHIWFNPVANDIDADRLEVAVYDPEGQNHILQTPYVDYKQFKGMTMTVPSDMIVTVKVLAVLKVPSSDLTVVFLRDFNPEFIDRGTGPLLEFLSMSPYTNHTLPFTTLTSYQKLSSQVIPQEPWSARDGTPCSPRFGCPWAVHVPPQSGVFAEANELIEVSNVTINKAKCMVLNGSGDPSTNCTPTTEPIIFKSGGSILLNPGVTVTEGANFTATIIDYNYQLPPVGPATLGTVSSPATCYNSSSIMRQEDNAFLEADTENGYLVHPNPISTGQLKFGRTIEKFELFNNTGAMVLQGRRSQYIDITGFSKGLYLLKLDGKLEKVIVE